MKRKTLLLLVVFILLTSAAQAGLMDTVPVGEKVYEWIYDYIDELYARGLIKGLHLGTKPYFRDQIAEELLRLRDKIEKKRELLAGRRVFCSRSWSTSFQRRSTR